MTLKAEKENIATSPKDIQDHVLEKLDSYTKIVGLTYLHKDIPGILGAADAYDQFGSALAAGDFDGDGKIDDLAVGAFQENNGSLINEGGAHVIYGSVFGLTASGDQAWHQNSSGIQGVAEKGDGFGWSLAAGDFDGNGKDDLAVGVPGEAIGSIYHAGAVNVLYGSNSGLTSSGNQLWHQNSAGIQGVAEKYDEFGGSLTTGDFNGDGKDDLVIGAFKEEVGSVWFAGAVNVLYGSNSGLTASGNQIWHQNTPGIIGIASDGDVFGKSLATGDFNGDGKDDLAIGAPGDVYASLKGAGSVNVLYGSNGGLSYSGNQQWYQDQYGVQGTSEQGDRFGESLATGDFNGDGKDDLAVGVPGEGMGSNSSAGAVNVLYGSNSGLTASGDQIWHQDSPGIQGVAESIDQFGATLGAGDFNGDGKDDLAIGVIKESIGSAFKAGAVNVIYGSNNGLTANGNQIWHQNSVGVQDDPELGDNFGISMSVGDFNRDGIDDLAIGIDEGIGSMNGAGAVQILYGSSNGLIAVG